MINSELQLCASQAKSNIAWLATTHIIVHSNSILIINSAKSLLDNPDSIQVNVNDEEEAKRIKEKIINYLKNFHGSIQANQLTDDFRQIQNKSIILGIDYIIQHHLDKMYETCAKTKKLNKKQLTKLNIYCKVKEIEKEVPKICINSLPSAKHVFFISQLRHSITHRNGEVDKVFLEKCGFNLSTMKLISDESRLWDKNIWPTEKEFLNRYKPPEKRQHYQLYLAIEDVILPYTDHASVFIDEVLNEFNRII